MDMTSNRATWLFATAVLLVTAPIAAAHPGHGAGFAAGAAHPLTGLDHLLVMLAVGVLAAKTGGRAVWASPAAFLALMAVGGWLARAGVAVPAVEQMVAASVCVVGLLLARAGRFPITVMTALVGLFALFHGYAHMSEAGGAGARGYVAGFLVTTAALHAVGIAIGAAAIRFNGDRLIRVVGMMTAVCGIVLSAGAL
jgi:urease accessory protein